MHPNMLQKLLLQDAYCVQIAIYMRVHLYQVSLITYNSSYNLAKATLLLS